MSNDDDLRWLYREDEDRTRILPDSDEPPSGYPDPRERYPQGYPASSATPPPPPPYRPTPQQEQRRSRRLTPGWVGERRKERRRRRRRPIRRTIVTLLLLWIAFLIGTPIYAYFRVSTVPGAESNLPSQPGNAVLLVGSDGRGDLSPEDRARLGTGSTEGRRTDTMMLLYTSPTGKSAMISLPRDSYVKIPGHGKNKLNAAYAIGGPQLLIETVEEATGVKVDGYLEIGMLGLVDMVDAVGGIEVCPKQAFKDRDSHLEMEAGCQQVDGVTALNYARMRKADKRGDLGRMERQREVVGQIVKKALSPMTFINPVRYWKLNVAAASTLRRTEGTDVVNVAGAGVGLVSGWTGSGITMTVPIADANARTKAGSSILWDKEAASEVFRAVQEGDMGALDQYR